MHLDLHEAVTSCCMVWGFCCLFGVLVSGFIFLHSVPFGYFADCKTSCKNCFILITKKQICF